MYDRATNLADMTRAGADMFSNGVNVSNVMQMASGAGGFAGDLTRKCFTAGTQIVVGMEYDENDVFVQYVTMNIEDVIVGDLVYSYDTLTGEVSFVAVTKTLELSSDHVRYVTVEDNYGNEQTLETTDGHPFWVVTDNPDLSRAANPFVDENGVILQHEEIGITDHGYWVEAKDLLEGDIVLGLNGELSEIRGTLRIDKSGGIAVFNLETDGNHNYYVIAKEFGYGQTCILVHNSSKKLPCEVTGPIDRTRTPQENRQARNYFKNHRDEAEQRWLDRTGKEKWPDDATHAEHPIPLKDGGDPLHIEPGYGGPNAAHQIPGKDGLTDAQRWGKMGGRPKKVTVTNE